MFGSKFWEEIFGEQILLNEKKIFFFGGGGGGGQNGEQFLFKTNFEEIFWTKFWRRDCC